MCPSTEHPRSTSRHYGLPVGETSSSPIIMPCPSALIRVATCTQSYVHGCLPPCTSFLTGAGGPVHLILSTCLHRNSVHIFLFTPQTKYDHRPNQPVLSQLDKVCPLSDRTRGPLDAEQGLDTSTQLSISILPSLPCQEGSSPSGDVTRLLKHSVF